MNNEMEYFEIEYLHVSFVVEYLLPYPIDLLLISSRSLFRAKIGHIILEIRSVLKMEGTYQNYFFGGPKLLTFLTKFLGDQKSQGPKRDWRQFSIPELKFKSRTDQLFYKLYLGSCKT